MGAVGGMVEDLEPSVSLILVLLEIEAPSVEVSEEVSGARTTGSVFFPSEVEARNFRFRCLKLT